MFLYSIPEKAYRLRHVDGTTRPCLFMSPYLIKAMRTFYVFNNIINQKYEPTQSSIYSFVCYQFAIYCYVGSIGEESTEDMEKKKKLWPLTIDHSGDNEDSISFSYFPNYSEIWSPPVLPLPEPQPDSASYLDWYSDFYNLSLDLNSIP